MMFIAFSALAFGRLVEKDTPYTEEQYWNMWKKFHELPEVASDRHFYETSAEHDKRFDIFKSNMDLAYEHNLDETQTFTMGITPFADMSRTEFLEWLQKSAGFKKPQDSLKIPHNVFDKTLYTDVPAEIDWSEQGYVTPIKNQGSCGSCWAFSTTGGIEGQNYKKTGKLSSFSEQQLVDCSSSEGNQGCNGGLMDQGFQYVEEKGLCFESEYPYTGTDDSCKETQCTSQVSVKSFTDVPAGDTDALKTACGTQGPISIAVDATFLGWQMYTGGILKNCAKKLDHGVLLVGYSTSGGYWKVKNSWGASWGEQGYIRLAAFADTCGLSDSASYPVM